jgi:hypothetical protein
MNKYSWRNNITAVASSTRAKIAVKTKETTWLQTDNPVIVLMSVHSDFHRGVAGDLKTNALMSTIKTHVRGEITVLIADSAHINTLGLKTERPLTVCKKDAVELASRYDEYFNGCYVAFWHSFIGNDKVYDVCRKAICELYNNDLEFKKQLYADAAACYSPIRAQEYPDKAQFIERTIEDLLEQCTCLLVIAEKGYRYQFYPGRSHASTEYVNKLLLPAEMQLSWIDLFLTIEKKTEMTCCK